MTARKVHRDAQRLTPAQVEAFRDGMRHLRDKGYELPTYFARIGCKGATDSPVSCPVAQYLSKRAGRTVLVGTSKATLIGGRAMNVTSPLPANVVGFVMRFDRHHYPELER